MLDGLHGPNINTRFFPGESWEGEKKMMVKTKVTRQVMQAASKGWQRQRVDSPLEPPEKDSPVTP